MSRKRAAIAALIGVIGGAIAGSPYLDDAGACTAAGGNGFQCALNEAIGPFISAIAIGFCVAILSRTCSPCSAAGSWLPPRAGVAEQAGGDGGRRSRPADRLLGTAAARALSRGREQSPADASRRTARRRIASAREPRRRARLARQAGSDAAPRRLSTDSRDRRWGGAKFVLALLRRLPWVHERRLATMLVADGAVRAVAGCGGDDAPITADLEHDARGDDDGDRRDHRRSSSAAATRAAPRPTRRSPTSRRDRVSSATATQQSSITQGLIESLQALGEPEDPTGALADFYRRSRGPGHGPRSSRRPRRPRGDTTTAATLATELDAARVRGCDRGDRVRLRGVRPGGRALCRRRASTTATPGKQHDTVRADDHGRLPRPRSGRRRSSRPPSRRSSRRPRRRAARAPGSRPRPQRPTERRQPRQRRRLARRRTRPA